MKKEIVSVLATVIVASSASAFPFQNVQFSQDGRPERIFEPLTGFNGADKLFLKQAAVGDLFEIQSSRLALEKSSDPFVTEYAKEIIADHTMAQDEVKEVADKRSLTLPENLPAPQAHLLKHLANLNGVAFDHAYELAQRESHAAASMLYKNEIENGRNEDAMDYVTKALPEIVMHYRMVIMKKTMMGPTKLNGGE